MEHGSPRSAAEEAEELLQWPRKAMSRESRYGELIRVDLGAGSSEVLQRVRLGLRAADGGVDEATLQKLLFDHPECLPIAAIDSAYGDAVPICRELSVPAGSIDALYVNALGRLTLCEFKLWRNPQARREVIGQILDYAKDLASWSYEDLQRQVSLALGGEGSNILYKLVSKRHPDVIEAEFVDNVTRHLRRGEFLLLIVGDGIRERAEKIVDFVQSHSGLRFNLALVEAALYRDGVDRLLVQPRVLARTEIVQRFVVEGAAPVQSVEEEADVPEGDWEKETGRFWRAVFSEDFAFADPDSELDEGFPKSVKVRGAGLNGNALRFVFSLSGYGSDIRCYLSARKGSAREERIFDEALAAVEDLRGEMQPPASDGHRSWDDLEEWRTSRGGKCVGFRRECAPPLIGSSEESAEFQEAVAWTRDRANRLVSVLHPRLRRMLADG